MKNTYSTRKNNKKNRRRSNIKTRSIQRGGIAGFLADVATGMGAEALLRSATTAGSEIQQSALQPRQSASQPPQENNDSSFSIDLTNLKESLLSQLMGILQDSEKDDIPPEKKGEIVDYIKNSDYITALRRSFHNPTDLQKGMQDFIDGIQAKILEYPEKWQASFSEKKNNLLANNLLQNSLDNFSTAVKDGKQMSIDKLQQLWSVVNTAKDCMGGATQSSTSESEGGEGGESVEGEEGLKSVEGVKSGEGEKSGEGGVEKAKSAPAAATPEKGVLNPIEGKASELGSLFESVEKAALQKGGKVNVHEHPRRYIKEIKDNRKKLYEKEMEIIRSIRNFNNGHTRTHNHLHSRNKYHTRKFRRAIMK